MTGTLPNYSTTVSADRSISEIQKLLASFGARKVMVDYDEHGRVVGLTFAVEGVDGMEGYRLPANYKAVQRILEDQHRRRKASKAQTTEQHAINVAWRLVRDWVRAQLGILQSQMVTLDEVMLPYRVDRSGRTLYQLVQEGRLQLPEGREGP